MCDSLAAYQQCETPSVEEKNNVRCNKLAGEVSEVRRLMARFDGKVLECFCGSRGARDGVLQVEKKEASCGMKGTEKMAAAPGSL